MMGAAVRCFTSWDLGELLPVKQPTLGYVEKWSALIKGSFLCLEVVSSPTALIYWLAETDFEDGS